MHPHIKHLYEIAGKKERRVIGLMSGTSLDGLDIALCLIGDSGIHTRVKLEQFATIPYDDHFRSQLKLVFSKKQINLEQLCLLNPWIARQQAKMILDCLTGWGIQSSDIDLLASHGQTVYHAPFSLHKTEGFGNATLQLGDGDHLAVLTGIITLSDFRQKHIAGGGEGAPLAPYGDYLLFSRSGLNRLLLNIGGIANFTFLSYDLDPLKVLSSDTGPGNTMMDAFIQNRFPGRTYDEDAAIALRGTVNPELLGALREHSFFKEGFPKSTGPELFNLDYLQEAIDRSAMNQLSNEDLMATLNRFTSSTITDAIKQIRLSPQSPGMTIYASGGGSHNPMLLRDLGKDLPEFPIRFTDELGIPSDAKEAVLFAVLANETIAGSAIHLRNIPAGLPGISMGKLSFPD